MNAFENVIGYEKEKEELLQICDMVRNPQKYAALGVRLPRGVLLYGEPGVGKTLMAGELIKEMGRRVYTIRKDRGDDEFIKHISEVFAEAKENAPSVVFLDDMDKFAESENRGSCCNAEEYVAVQSGIDAVKNAEVFVVATANDILELPFSLRRAGRFDRVMRIEMPNRREAVEIVRHYLKNKKVSKDVTPELVARLMDGNSCAALESVLNEAGIYAGYEGSPEISRDHVIRAILREIFEAEGTANEMSVTEKQEVAYHEAGHVAVAMSFNSNSIGIVSIRPSKSDARGVVQILRDEDYFGSYEKMRQRVLSLLAGRAAVELKFGRVDAGATSDLARATSVIQRFVGSYGVSGFNFLSMIGRYCLNSKEKEEEVVSESNNVLARMYEETKTLLRANWKFVEDVVEALIERDTLIYEDLEEIRNRTIAKNGGVMA